MAPHPAVGHRAIARRHLQGVPGSLRRRRTARWCCRPAGTVLTNRESAGSRDYSIRCVEYLAHADRNELLELRARLERLEAKRDDRRAVHVLASIGVEAPSGGWFANAEHRKEIYTVLALITLIITTVLLGRLNSGLSPPNVVLIFREKSRTAGP